MATLSIIVQAGADGNSDTVYGHGLLTGLRHDSDPHGDDRAYIQPKGEGPTATFDGVVQGEDYAPLFGGLSPGGSIRVSSAEVSGTVTAMAGSNTGGVYGTVAAPETASQGAGKRLGGVEVRATQSGRDFFTFTETNRNGRYTIPLPHSTVEVSGFDTSQDLTLTFARQRPGVSNRTATVAAQAESGWANAETERYDHTLVRH